MGSPLGLLSHADSHSLGDVGACVGYGGSRAESRCVVILSSRRILELPFRVGDRETPRATVDRRRAVPGAGSSATKKKSCIPGLMFSSVRCAAATFFRKD